jgi:hypothetical protein
MKLLLSSLVATVGVLLVACPATVSAQTAVPGRPNEFTLPDGGSFACSIAGSRCQIDGEFSVMIDGGRITNLADGPQWTVLDPTSDLLTVGACSGSDCSVTCNYECSCTQPDNTECPFVVVTRTPTQAPSFADKDLTTFSPTRAPTSGAGSWQSSTGLALVMAAMVSALVGL